MQVYISQETQQPHQHPTAGWMPSCCPTNSIKALKAKIIIIIIIEYYTHLFIIIIIIIITSRFSACGFVLVGLKKIIIIINRSV